MEQTETQDEIIHKEIEDAVVAKLEKVITPKKELSDKQKAHLNKLAIIRSGKKYVVKEVEKKPKKKKVVVSSSDSDSSTDSEEERRCKKKSKKHKKEKKTRYVSSSSESESDEPVRQQIQQQPNYFGIC